MSNMIKAIVSMLIGFAIFWYVDTMLHTIIPPLNEIASWTLTAAVFVVIFGMGLNSLGPVEEGVPLILGQRIRWYTIPPGFSWFPTFPVGDKIVTNTAQRTLDRRRKNDDDPKAPGPLHVLAKGDIDINMSMLVQYTLVRPFIYTGVTSPDEAFEALMGMAARWFASHYDVEELPGHCGKASKFLEGKDNTIHIEGKDADGNDIKPQTYTTNIRDAALTLGFRIDKVFVDDYDIPKEIIEANKKKITEKAEAESEATETDNVIELMKKYKAAFKDLSDSQILDAVQRERGKVKGYSFSGGEAGDFAKGAAINQDDRD